MTTATQTEPLEGRAEKRLAELTKQRAGMKDDLDLPGNLTLRERHAYVEQRLTLDRQIDAIRAAAAATSFPDLDADEQWHAQLKRWRDIIGDELVTHTMPVRGDAKQRVDHLGWCLRLIDRGFSIAPTTMPIVDLTSTRIGELMAAGGVPTSGEALQRSWRGGLAAVERRIKQRRAERDAAIAKLEASLLSDEARAKQDEQFSAALRSMKIQINSAGNGLVAFTHDDEPLPVAKMSTEQRAAFEKFERASFPPREQVDV